MTRPVALMLVYLAVLAGLTFFPFDGFSGSEPVDLRLQAFRTINFALKKGLGSREFLILIGNLVAFMPLGMLVPQITGRRSLLMVFVVGLALSFAIEAGQLAISIALGFAYRSADIDDVIVNVAGAVVGYLIYVVVMAMRARKAGGTAGGE